MKQETSAAKSLSPDRGSFRDRNNRVYDDGTRIYRGISDEALHNWTKISSENFFKAMMRHSKVVPTELVDGMEIPHNSAASKWPAVMSHERVPFISYPYEWSFGMLKDAALLTLDLLERSIPNGWTLKDASAYNVQWVNCRPVFIDVPSFEPYTAGDPWRGYRQFCMMFLFPLMLRAYKEIDYIPLLRSSLEGIDPSLASKILTGFSRFRKGVFGNVYLHAKMQQRAASRDLNEAKSLTETAQGNVSRSRSFKHSEAMVLGTIQGLRRTINKLQTPESRTTWGSYDTDHSYAEASFDSKKSFVERHAAEKHRKMVWDIGCNTGTFSRLAGKGADVVISIDGDAKAIDRLYNYEKAQPASNILPLIMDLSNVSPNQGWRGAERKALDGRGKPDLVLCLALIHHIVISANIPLSEFVDWLHSLGSDLIIEFVSVSDDMSQMLLRNKVNQYDDFTEAHFEEIVKKKYAIIDAESLKGGARKIYYLRPL